MVVVVELNAAPPLEKNTGIGIILGEPTGISFKFWPSEEKAIDGALAWSFRKKGSFHAHADYLYHNYQAFNDKTSKFPFYYGIGGRLESRDEVRIGLRIPFGVNFLFDNFPIDLFFELVPVLNLLPETEFDFNGGIGARYYF